MSGLAKTPFNGVAAVNINMPHAAPGNTQANSESHNSGSSIGHKQVLSSTGILQHKAGLQERFSKLKLRRIEIARFNELMIKGLIDDVRDFKDRVQTDRYDAQFCQDLLMQCSDFENELHYQIQSTSWKENAGKLVKLTYPHEATAGSTEEQDITTRSIMGCGTENFRSLQTDQKEEERMDHKTDGPMKRVHDKVSGNPDLEIKKTKSSHIIRKTELTYQKPHHDDLAHMDNKTTSANNQQLENEENEAACKIQCQTASEVLVGPDFTSSRAPTEIKNVVHTNTQQESDKVLSVFNSLQADSKIDDIVHTNSQEDASRIHGVANTNDQEDASISHNVANTNSQEEASSVHDVANITGQREASSVNDVVNINSDVIHASCQSMPMSVHAVSSTNCQQASSNVQDAANTNSQQTSSNDQEAASTNNQQTSSNYHDAASINSQQASSNVQHVVDSCSQQAANVIHVISQQSEPMVRPHVNSVDLLLIGNSGNGKSATGNSILNRTAFKRSASSVVSESSSSSIIAESAKIEDKIVNVIDGPSINNFGNIKLEDLLKLIEAIDQSLKLCNYGFTALLIVLKFGQRFTKQEVETIKVIKSVLGKNVIRDYGVCVITHGDNFEYAVEDAKEDGEDLTFSGWLDQQTGEVKNLFEECNHRYVLFDNATKDDKKRNNQVKKLMDVIPQGKRYTKEEFLQAGDSQQELAMEASLPLILKEMHTEVEKIRERMNEVEKEKEENTDLYKAKMESLITELSKQKEKINKIGIKSSDIEGMKFFLATMETEINLKVKQRLVSRNLKKYTETQNMALEPKTAATPKRSKKDDSDFEWIPSVPQEVQQNDQVSSKVGIRSSTPLHQMTMHGLNRNEPSDIYTASSRGNTADNNGAYYSAHRSQRSESFNLEIVPTQQQESFYEIIKARVLHWFNRL